MIHLYSAADAPKVIRKSFEHSDDVLLKAREFFRRNKDMRRHKIVVYEGGEPAYCLGWHKNLPVNVTKDKPTVQMQLSNYWDYDVDVADPDTRYVNRYGLIIFSEFEEYSWASTRVMLEKCPGVKVAFIDRNAERFFGGEERVFIADTEDELFAAHPELKEGRILRAFPEIVWNIRDFFAGKVPSILVMSSLFWLKREFCYGPLNPDKTFYLIKQPVKENGLTNVVANVIGLANMLKAQHPDFIPVVDLGVSGDVNQFTGTSGEDTWTMFYEPLSKYSWQEVYSSQHVILDQNSNVNMNPYLTEFVFTNQRAEVKFGGLLRYRPEVRDYIDRKLSAIWPEEGSRILGVVARGSDYTAKRVAAYIPKGITVEELLEKVKGCVAEKKFDYVFLATEDEAYLRMFRESDLGAPLITVDQDRIDYEKEENREMLLLEIFARDKSDPMRRTLDYLTVLEGLRRCGALMANVTCGAVQYALGWEPPYEFVDVPKIGY